MKPLAYAALAALLTPAIAQAHDYKIGNLVIEHPVAFETPKTAMSGAGYMIITNAGDTVDYLTAVDADFPRVMIHTTEEKDGIAKMKHVDRIEIAPGETVFLQPGGFHVMFMGLKGDPLEDGEKISATLTFEKAGTIHVVFNVEPRPDGDQHETDHSDHGS